MTEHSDFLPLRCRVASQEVSSASESVGWIGGAKLLNEPPQPRRNTKKGINMENMEKYIYIYINTTAP